MKKDMLDPAKLASLNQWLAEPMDEIVHTYAGKFVAVHEQRIVAIGDSYRDVYAGAENQGLDEIPFVMEVPTADELSSSLPTVF
ncbi:MAG: hypothetical protein FJ398_07535 [Verrucomicrobia bacterium]|nr:hypothetical protein [Verrucomicrobiota bacterium]